MSDKFWLYAAWLILAAGAYLGLFWWMQVQPVTIERCSTQQSRYLTPAQLKQCMELLP